MPYTWLMAVSATLGKGGVGRRASGEWIEDEGSTDSYIDCAFLGFFYGLWYEKERLTMVRHEQTVMPKLA